MKPRKPNAISRRSFIKGAGAVAAAAGLVRVPSASAEVKTLPPGVVEKLGPEAATIELKINGRAATLESSRASRCCALFASILD